MCQILQHHSSKSSLFSPIYRFYLHSIVIYGYILISLGLTTMDYLKRIEQKIRNSYPEITEDELHCRMELIKHLIAIQHQKNKTFRKENLHHVG